MTNFMRIFSLFCCISVISGCFHKNKAAQQWIISPEGATSISFSKQGRFVLSASNTDGIQLWDLFENKRLAEFGFQDPEKSTVIASKISDNKQFAITATSQNFAVWNLAWSQAKGLWSISNGRILSADISNTGNQILLALSNNKALFIDIDSGNRLEFLAHQEKVNTVALSPNGKYALTGGNDRFAYLWDTKTAEIIRQFPSKNRITRVALDRNARYAFVANADAEANIWDIKDGTLSSQLDIYQRHKNFSSARFSDDGSYLATGTPSGNINLWDTKTGEGVKQWEAKPLQKSHPPSAVVYDVAIDPTNRVLSGASSGVVQAWLID